MNPDLYSHSAIGWGVVPWPYRKVSQLPKRKDLLEIVLHMAISVNRTATLGKPKNLTKRADQAGQLVSS
jgi:hypothetical protein